MAHTHDDPRTLERLCQHLHPKDRRLALPGNEHKGNGAGHAPGIDPRMVVRAHHRHVPGLEPRRRRLLLHVQLELAGEHDPVVDGIGRVPAQPALGANADAKCVQADGRAADWGSIVIALCTGSTAMRLVLAAGSSLNISAELHVPPHASKCSLNMLGVGPSDTMNDWPSSFTPVTTRRLLIAICSSAAAPDARACTNRMIRAVVMEVVKMIAASCELDPAKRAHGAPKSISISADAPMDCRGRGFGRGGGV